MLNFYHHESPNALCRGPLMPTKMKLPRARDK